MPSSARPKRRSRSLLGAAASRRVAAAVLAALAWEAPYAQAPVADDSLKAAFALNFAKFTEWPAERMADPSGRLALCVTGERAEGSNAYTELAGKSVQGRAVEVRWVVRRTETAGCWVLVITERDRAVGEWLRAVKDHPILTVGDAEKFVEAGGMLGLFPADSRIRFDANLEAARVANLRLSSHLLKLARSVIGAPGAKP
jgi:hypothetical protein